MAFYCKFVVWIGLQNCSSDITSVSDLPYLNEYLGFHLGSFLDFCRLKLWGGGHCCMMNVFMVPVMGTPVLNRLCCLCHPVAHRGVRGLLLTLEWRGHRWVLPHHIPAGWCHVSPTTWLCIEISACHDCVSQFCLLSPQGSPNLLPWCRWKGACFCWWESGICVSHLIFCSNAQWFRWPCEPLIQVKGGYCLAKISPNYYSHAMALMPLSDCEIMKH